MIVRATLYGPAQSQGSKRIGRAPDGRPITLDASGKTRPWRNELTLLMLADKPESPWDVTVQVSLSIFVARPRGQFGTGRNSDRLKPSAENRPKSGKDIDKVLRCVLDAGKGVWWTDDQRVAEVTVYRLYAGISPWGKDFGPERVEVSACPV